MSILQNGLIFRREHVSYVSAQVRGHLRLAAVGKVDDLHFLALRNKNGIEVSNHCKYIANEFPITLIMIGVGLEGRGLFDEGDSYEDAVLAQTGRRTTRLGMEPFLINTDEGRASWRNTLLAIEQRLGLARK